MALRAIKLDEKPTKWISPNKCAQTPVGRRLSTERANRAKSAPWWGVAYGSLKLITTLTSLSTGTPWT